MLSITYGGSVSSVFKDKNRYAAYRSYFKDGDGSFKESPRISEYKQEVKRVLKKIKEEYPTLHDSVMIKENNHHQNQARTLSYLLHEIETCISAMAVLYLIDNGILKAEDDGSYQLAFLHDGFYVKKHEGINNQLLTDLSQHIKVHAGVDMKFGFKDVDPKFTAAEIAALESRQDLSEIDKIAKMWKMASQIFKFPEGTLPKDTLDDNYVLKTNNSYDIAVTHAH